MKNEFFKKTCTLVQTIKLISFLSIAILLMYACKKTKTNNYEDQAYKIQIDTATLKITVTGPNRLSGVDVTTDKTVLFLFDSKNMFYGQYFYNGITTEDTSIVLYGLPMGHYSALLVVDAPGVTNFSYLKQGKQSYQDVMDTLQYVLTYTYAGTAQNMLVNQKTNTGSLAMETLASLMSQVTFDLSTVQTAWKTAPAHTDGMAMLLFQNGSFVKQFPIADSNIQNGSFSTAIAQGANYSFLFTDLIDTTAVCRLQDSLQKGTSTIPMVQALAERYNNNIRMGVGVLEATIAKTIGSLPQATTTNLTKNTYNGFIENAMAQVSFTIDPAQNISTTKPINSDGLAFLEFQNGKFVRRMLVSDAEFATGTITVQILKGEKYDFLLVDLLKEDGQFELKKITDTPGYSIVTMNSIQGNVEPYNNKGNAGIMRMAAPSANNTLNANKTLPLINGLSTVTFNLAALVSKPLTESNLTDGFALLEFKDGILIKKTNIPYVTSGSTDIPATYTTSVVKSTGYSFWFVDLAKSADGKWQLKSSIIDNASSTTEKLVGNISINKIKSLTEPYLNQNMRMGTIDESNLTSNTASRDVTSLIQQVKLNFTGSMGCNDWTNAPNWSVLILDQTGYYKRTPIRNLDYTKLSTTLFNIFTGSKYYIVAMGGLGITINNVELPTTNYNTLATINTKYPAIQPNLYSWIAIDSCIGTQTTYENRVTTTGTISITATNTSSSPIKTLTQVDKIPLQTIPYLRSLGNNYNSFGCNPIRITGIVTSDGSGDNPIPNLIILQDATAITNAAIPIQFTTPTGLKKGDKVTIAIQDGNLTRLNTNASGLLVLQNVKYTIDPSNPLDPTKSYGVTTQPLGNITYSNLTTTKMDNLEAMLVSISNVEFRWFKGLSFNSNLPYDSIQLRDASVAATSLPSTRAVFRLKIDPSIDPTNFGTKDIPAGKGSVTGILTKNSSNKYAIQPQKYSDIFTDNSMSNRVDQGVLADWNPNASSYDGISTSGSLYLIDNTRDRGVAREGSSIQVTTDGPGTKAWNCVMGNGANGGTTGQGFTTIEGFYVALSTTAQLQASTANAGKGFVITLNTLNSMSKDESLYLSINGYRERTTTWPATTGGYTANINFQVQYSIDGGATWKQATTNNQTTTFDLVIAGVYGVTGKTDAFGVTNLIVPNIGGYPNVQIRIICVNGGTWSKGSLDSYISFYRFTLSQIP